MITYAQGVPNLKTASAILTRYSKVWNAKYWQTAILPDITTSKYFDELNVGDEVQVENEPTVTFNAYEAGQTLDVERINLTPTQLLIDKAGYFNVALNAVDKELSHLDLQRKYQEVGQKAGQKYIDQAFFAAMVDAAHASNKGATAGVISGQYALGTSGAGVGVNTSNVVEFLTRITAVMAEQVANENVWVVIPVWMRHLLLNSELKNAMAMGDATSVLRTGFLGMVDRAKFYVNTYLSGTGADATHPTAILAGNKEAISYTLRMNEAKLWDNGNFETYIQGLMVWGWKAVKPEGLVNAYAYKAAEA